MRTEKENRKKAIIGVVVFHLVLLICFYFFGLRIPVPMPEETGLTVELALGDSEFGSGDEQPQSTSIPEVSQPATEPVESNPVQAVEEITTQNEPSPVTVPDVKPEPKPEPKPEIDPRLRNALDGNPFQSNQNNTSTSQGSDNSNGDVGRPEGYQSGTSTTGDRGGGISSNLNGRGFKGAPRVQSTDQEAGKIVIDIIVDRNGNVIRASAGARGTTITNGALINKCLDSARKAKFTPKADAPEEQKGTIEYTFVLE